MEFCKEDLALIMAWFDFIEDMGSENINGHDCVLASKISKELGLKDSGFVKTSIARMLDESE